MHPQIPQFKPNPNLGVPSKLDETTLIEYYNKLTSLGFQVVAKRRTAKFPVQANWQNLPRHELAGNMQLQLQSRSSVSGWCVVTGSKSNLVVVDLDFQSIRDGGNDPTEVYKKIQELSPCSFVISTPTGGVHLYYTPIPDKKIRNRTDAGYKGIDVRGDGGQVVSLGGFNRYEDNHESKGVPYGHEGTYEMLPDGIYDKLPQMSEELYAFLYAGDKEEVNTSTAFSGDAMVFNYRHTEEGNKRIEDHFSEPLAKREQVVIECIEVIFNKWKYLSNDEWTQVWMSAFHGAPTQAVLETIIEKAHWKDGATGIRNFRKRWNTHQWQDDGYTVASLFWIARKAGWLRTTSYEIPERYIEYFNKQYVSDWVDEQPELPKHLLIESQTGSGKTRAFKTIWLRLGKPKTVIFVPTIKLATELYYTLTNELDLPATLYRDDDAGKTIAVELMKDATILVTTLQTFATKLYDSGVDIRTYGLVYVEEIDQLISGFALGGGGASKLGYNSHVSDKQATLGFKVLQDAYAMAGHVYGVDATMSQVSSSLAFQMTNQTVKIIRNTYVHKKAHVKFLQEVNQAYQIAYEALGKGEKVVIIADKASKANEAYEAMIALGCVKPEEAIVINRYTAGKKRVIKFMQDVNAGAEAYRLVVYNSIMGSGVSITKVVPDTIVQICEYLPPRNNLQMLNRYRKQSKVYVYMAKSEKLYVNTAKDILNRAREFVDIEAGLVRLPAIDRSKIAKTRDSLASISIADKQAQWRAPYIMYQHLLEQDGRTYTATDVILEGDLKHTIKDVRKIQKEKAKYINANWHTVRPVTQDEPATADMTDMEVALGLQHGKIYKVLKGNVPQVMTTEQAEYISEVVKTLKSHGYALSEFMEQGKALNRSERFLLNSDKPFTSLNGSVAKITAVSMLSLLYQDMRQSITDVELAHVAPKFVDEIRLNKQLYNSVVGRTREHFEAIYDPEDIPNTAIKLAKTLLRQIGLKQKKRRVRKSGIAYQIEIDNIGMVEDFLAWRNAESPDFKITYMFTTKTIEDELDKRKSSDEIFADMSDSDVERVLHMIKEERCAFEYAVNTVYSGVLM